jgi:hypothetical protein
VGAARKLKSEPMSREEARAMARSIRAYTRAQTRLDKQLPALMKKYPNRWIVVHRNAVIATGRSSRTALAKSDKLGISRDEILLEFLSAKPYRLIV